MSVGGCDLGGFLKSIWDTFSALNGIVELFVAIGLLSAVAISVRKRIAWLVFLAMLIVSWTYSYQIYETTEIQKCQIERLGMAHTTDMVI